MPQGSSGESSSGTNGGSPGSEPVPTDDAGTAEPGTTTTTTPKSDAGKPAPQPQPGPGGTGATSGTIYQVIQGHDGDPDPDDNLAALAGFFAIKRNAERSAGHVEQLGMVYADTTANRKNAMLNGKGSGYGNYRFFQQYTKPALESAGSPTVIDELPTTWNFNAVSRDQLSPGGRYVYDTIKSAIDTSTAAKTYRVVYSAGGGHNAPYEAIQLLRKDGRTNDQIGAHFAIVQHSGWNLDNCNENGVQAGTLPFAIRIEDQNRYTGGPTNNAPAPPMPVSANRTTAIFANAWDIATGFNGARPNPAIANFQTTKDASDAGSHHFASNVTALDSNWGTRNNRNSPVSYNQYTVKNIIADMVTK
jgi:hypothetical protein